MSRTPQQLETSLNIAAAAMFKMAKDSRLQQRRRIAAAEHGKLLRESADMIGHLDRMASAAK